MTPDVRAALRTAAAAGMILMLPPEVVLALLAGSSEEADAPPRVVVDHTCTEAGALLGRAASTVRGWCEAGILHGYRMRAREWRIPAAEVERFQQAERERGAGKAAGVSPLRRGKTPDLGSWRRVG